MERDHRLIKYSHDAKDQEKMKVEKAVECPVDLSSVKGNGDILKIKKFRACFSKGFSHNNIDVDIDEYEKFVYSIFRNKPELLSKIKLGTKNGMKLGNPSCIYDLELNCAYKATYNINGCASITSDESAAELVELYEMARVRDIAFIDYQGSGDIKIAANNLSSLRKFDAPKVLGEVTPNTIFRPNNSGSLEGPYVSQFLLLPIKFGLTNIEQKYNLLQPGHDYLTDIPTYLATWNGVENKPPLLTTKDKLYIYSLRAGASYVRVDEPCQPFVNAARILSELKVPIIPYSEKQNNEAGFVTLGVVDLHDLMHRASKLCLDLCWWIKWTHLCCRPEEFAYKVDLNKSGHEVMKISNEILKNPILSYFKAKYGNYLLPQAYPNGAPLHPSYPSGHATLAGALVTILKAWYDCEHLFDKIFIPTSDGKNLVDTGDKLTIGGELDKLAYNCVIFRNAAGIHYRSDVNGVEHGEKIAINLLEEFVHRYKRKIIFKFRKFNGKKKVISNCE